MKTRIILIAFLLSWGSTASAEGNPFDSAIKDLKAHEIAGDTDAAPCLVGAYMSGYAPGIDVSEDIAIVKKQALKGNQDAKYLLAAYEWQQRGQRPDDHFILKDLSAFAHQGNGHAYLNLGETYLFPNYYSPFKPDYKTALKMFEQALAKGVSSSASYLAVMYAHGWGVPADESAASKYIGEAVHPSIDCFTEFAQLEYLVAWARVKYPEAVLDGTSWNSVWLSYGAKDGHAVDVAVDRSSGNADVDQAAVAAITNMPVGNWSYLAAHPDFRMSTRMDMNLLTAEPIAISQLSTDLGRSVLATLWAEWDAHPYHPQKTGVATVMFTYSDGVVSNPTLIESTGDKFSDAAMLSAITAAAPVATPPEFKGRKLQLRLRFADLWNARRDWAPEDSPQTEFAYEVRSAIDKAIVIPKHALIFGTAGTGIVTLSFDYKDGKVYDVKIMQGSGDQEIDDEAMRAAAAAEYPKPPSTMAHLRVHMTDHVVFQVGFIATGKTSAPSPSTVDSPSATTVVH